MKVRVRARGAALLLTSLGLVLTTLTPSNGADIFDLLPGGRESKGYYGVTFTERQADAAENISKIISNTSPEEKVNNVGGLFYCKSMDDPECSKGAYIAAHIILPPCAQSSDRICIEGLSIGQTGKPNEKAKLLREVASLTSPADSLTGLPRGGGPSLWQVETVAHAGGELTYGVIARVNYFQNRIKSGAQGNRTAPITLTGMKLAVVPIKVVNGKFSALEISKGVNSDGGQSFGVKQSISDFDSFSDCAWLESGNCGRYTEFAADTRVGLTLRMGSELTGWLYGRMKNVNVIINPLDSKFNQITIEGDSVAIPGAYGFIKKSALKDNPKLDQRIRLGSGEFGYNELIKAEGSGVGSYDPVGNFEDFATFEPILKSMPSPKSQWVISAGASANGYLATNNNKCFNDKTKLSGIVTTNAFVYAPGTPEFKDGTLNYKVAGLHHEADGVTLTRGTYDLAIRSEVARCLYGFTDAPFQASISVISSDGSEQSIATESIKEDTKREWLFLSAQNFTFSAPTIRVKLTQAQKLAPQKATSNKAVAKITINCKKGQVTKKISGSKPTCPNGFVKK